jgi:hypothetical protein
MKHYTVYYYRPLKKSGYVSTTVEANTEDEALELAHKKTLIYKKYLTIHKPPYEVL